MNIHTIFFLKILAIYSPKRTKLHNFLKFSWGAYPRTKGVFKGGGRVQEVQTPPEIFRFFFEK